ncbi:hypothetical protein HWV62_22433 [Athelia sp. TMB]|nr:hypothetical protein HWV62_27769 [Athelia sp. TMB]KAF7983406.1 hypothetical protein HWV62_22433 [Athelia sp. TMB]
MSASNHLDLAPPLVRSGRVEELTKLGQTLRSTFSPSNNSLAVYVSSSAPTGQKSEEPHEQPVYFASMDAAPSSERRLFLSDTSVIFAAFQNFTNAAKERDNEWVQDEQNLEIIRKLANDYINHIKECWIHASQPIGHPEGPLQYSSEHYRILYTCFSLFVVLYLPESGLDDAPVGDDLMEWLNTHFIEPSTEEGDHLSGMEQPWEDDTFWPYLTRATVRGLSKASVFFLGILSRHPSEDLQHLSKSLVPLIESHPRLHNFSTERDFAYASRRWNDKVKALRLELDRVPENDRHDGFDNWWERVSDIVGALEGREEILKKICEDIGGDWKEIAAAWGVFVEPRLRRQDLPDIVGQTLDDMPPDPTNLEDQIHAALFSGHPDRALEHAARLDPWLAAHLADFMSVLALIETDVDSENSRGNYTLAYAEYLQSDSALWRITVAYLCSCGDIGKQRADEVILRVPLQLRKQAGSLEDERIRAGDVVGVLKEVNSTCFEYQREQVRRTICRIASQSFIEDKEFGLAVSYCASAEDWPGLGRVVDRVLDEYIVNGPVHFARYVAAIAPSLQALRAQPGSPGVFVYRLMFAVRYAEFQRKCMQQDVEEAALDLVNMLQDDIAPKSWWAVLLCDAVTLLQNPVLLFSYSGACQLLKRLEEIFIRAEQGSGIDYLDVLMRTMNNVGEKEALNRLKTVRLSLARYFARCTVIDVGGKHITERRVVA